VADDDGGEQDAAADAGNAQDAESFKLVLKAVKKRQLPELNEDFFKLASNNRSENLEDFRSYLKSSVQDYYDKASSDIMRDRMIEAIIEAHDFEVPEVLIEQLQNNQLKTMARNNKDQLPEGFDMDEFRKNSRPNAILEAKWMFIASKYMEKFDDLELNPEDVDSFMQAEAAKYGLSVEMIKNYYASSPEQLENLRNTIRTDKLFKKLADEIGTNELSRDEYREKYSKRQEHDHDHDHDHDQDHDHDHHTHDHDHNHTHDHDHKHDH
jgi:trigger factor